MRRVTSANSPLLKRVLNPKTDLTTESLLVVFLHIQCLCITNTFREKGFKLNLLLSFALLFLSGGKSILSITA